MKCPTCSDERLVMTERSGIEIDYCPTCRGVWLDRGELDKIIERSLGGPAPAAMPTPTETVQAGTVQGRLASVSPRPEDRDDRYAVQPTQRPRDDDRYDDRPERRDFDGDRFDGDRSGEDRYDDRDGGKRRPKKRRESLLSELFDF